MDVFIIFCAKYLVYVIALAAVGYGFISSARKPIALLGLVSLPLAFIVGKIAGLLWYDPLPFVAGNFTPLIEHAANNGFPSDHVLLSATLAAIIFSYHRVLGTVLFAGAGIIGIARMLAGVHHGIDVIAALIIAAAAVWCARMAISYFLKAKASYI